MIRKSRNKSLFKELLLGNLFAIFLLVISATGLIFVLEKLENTSFIEKRKLEIISHIKSNQEMWIAWKMLGQITPLQNSLAKTAEHLDLEYLKLYPKEFTKTVTSDSFVFVSELGDELKDISWVVVAKIADRTSKISSYYSLFFLLFILTLGVFLYSILIMQARVFLPLKQFLTDNRRPKNISTSGEVSDLLNLFDIMCDKIRISERSFVIARVNQTLAHDVRTPLEKIRLMTKVLPEQLKKNENDLSFLNQFSSSINQQIQRVNLMLEDILELGRSTKKFTEKVLLANIINDCFQDLNEIYPNAKVTLTNSVDANLAVLSCNEKLYRLFINIMKNAFEAMHFSGELWVQSYPKKNEVRIEISNSGPAIPHQIAQTLFDPFVSSDDKKQGTGLGLAIAKKVVEEHGGKIWCESNLGSQKTSFCFILPLA